MIRFRLTALTRIRPRAPQHRVAAVGLVCTLVAGMGVAAEAATPTVAPAPPAAVTPAAQPRAVSSSTVTLITGDAVRLDTMEDGSTRATVLPPADGRADPAGTTAAQFTWQGDEYVIPAEAVPYLGDTLDMRLFNVSYLARAELDDHGSATLPVTVEATAGKAKGLPGARVTATKGATASVQVAKTGTPAFGRMLAENWRAAGHGTSTTSAGRLPGVTRVALAPPAAAPPLPAAPSQTDTLSSSSTNNRARFHRVKVDAVDLDGRPGLMLGFLHSVDDVNLGTFVVNTATYGPTEPVFSVPAGTYSLEVSVFTGPGADLTSRAAFVVEPEVTVSADRTITLDARKAVPYRTTVDPAPAGEQDALRTDMIAFKRTAAAGNSVGVDLSGVNGIAYLLGMRLYSYPFNGSPALLATPTDPVSKGRFDLMAVTNLYTGPAAAPQDGPQYTMVFPYEDRIPDSLTRTVRAADLTTVHSTIHEAPHDNPLRSVNFFPTVYLPWTYLNSAANGYVTPGERTDYWYSSAPDQVLWEQAYGAWLGARQYGPRRKIQPGQEIRESWNKWPMVPARAASYLQRGAIGVQGTPDLGVDGPLAQGCTACRQDDLGVAYLRMFGDSDPWHYSDDVQLDSTVEFYRDEELAFTSDTMFPALNPVALDLPMLPGSASYRLKWTNGMTGLVGPSTTVDWTFRSAPTDPAANLPETVSCAPDTSRGCSFLPLLFVRYDLTLDSASRTAAGQPFEIRFAVDRQEHQAGASGLEATVAVSYDDGATWSAPRPATRGVDGMFTTSIEHPDIAATSGFVSLRVQAHDDSGNAVELTTVQAYGLTVPSGSNR